MQLYDYNVNVRLVIPGRRYYMQCEDVYFFRYDEKKKKRTNVYNDFMSYINKEKGHNVFRPDRFSFLFAS